MSDISSDENDQPVKKSRLNIQVDKIKELRNKRIQDQQDMYKEKMQIKKAEARLNFDEVKRL